MTALISASVTGRMIIIVGLVGTFFLHEFGGGKMFLSLFAIEARQWLVLSWF